MTQLDVLLVNNFFSPEEAGKYAAAATLGKAVLYLPGGIVMALFPMVTEAQAKAAKVSNYILTASGMTFAMCMVVVIFYWFAGQEVIRLFFGEKYAGAEEILKYYSLAMLPMALLIVAEYFLMALGKAVYAWLSFIFAPAQILLIYFYHDNLLSVLTIVGVSGLLLLICGYLFLFKLIRSNSGQKVLI
jgi:O-antigen/teichoic acid export membrane protein